MNGVWGGREDNVQCIKIEGLNGNSKFHDLFNMEEKFCAFVRQKSLSFQKKKMFTDMLLLAYGYSEVSVKYLTAAFTVEASHM